MRLSAIALAIALSMVSAARCAAATEGGNGESGGTPPTVEPAKDEEVLRLVYYVVITGVPEKREPWLRKVLAFDRERVVAALAATIPDPGRGRPYVSFAAKYLPDARLVPVVAARIRASEGALLNDTLERLRWAPREFLCGLVPALIEHALDSDYEGRGGPSGMRRSCSALAETTELLDAITEGKTGIKPVSSSEITAMYEPEREARKAQVRAAWRKWWEENKAEWEAEPKPEAEAFALQPPVPPGPIQAREDEEVLRLFNQWASADSAMTSHKFVRALLKMDRGRVLATLAFKIPDPKGGQRAFHFALRYLPERRRLVPFIAARIRSCTDAALLRTVESLGAMPDRGLVGPLIEHALGSDYEYPIRRPYPYPYPWSVLVETTRLLDKITEGKTGIKPVSPSELLGIRIFRTTDEEKRKVKAKKEEVRAAWRKWWEENKAEWEAEPKPEEEAPAHQPQAPPSVTAPGNVADVATFEKVYNIKADTK